MDALDVAVMVALVLDVLHAAVMELECLNSWGMSKGVE